MKKYSFSDSERWAIFSTYGQNCYICRNPINLASMHVDHVVPESLIDDSDRLSVVLSDLGLPADFSLNDFGNWLPSCGPCNLAKRELVFEPSPLIQIQLQRAREKANIARTASQRVVSDRQVSKAFVTLKAHKGEGKLTVKDIAPLVVDFIESNPELAKAIKADLGRVELSFGMAPEQVFELRLSDGAGVRIFSDASIRLVQGRIGQGYVPNDPQPDSSFYCGHCGSLGPWNGARCMSCGMLDAGD